MSSTQKFCCSNFSQSFRSSCSSSACDNVSFSKTRNFESWENVAANYPEVPLKKVDFEVMKTIALDRHGKLESHNVDTGELERNIQVLENDNANLKQEYLI